jgi:hypothetical protein
MALFTIVLDFGGGTASDAEAANAKLALVRWCEKMPRVTRAAIGTRAPDLLAAFKHRAKFASRNSCGRLVRISASE